MLAGDRAAVLDAKVDDGPGDLLGPLPFSVDGTVEEDERVKVAVARTVRGMTPSWTM